MTAPANERIARPAPRRRDLTRGRSAFPNTAIAKQATSVIPIVFAISNDPVGGGLVASLAQPGGNVTGLSLQATDLSGKRVELLRELVPQLRRLAVIGNVGFRDAVLEMANVRAASRALGLGWGCCVSFAPQLLALLRW